MGRKGGRKQVKVDTTPKNTGIPAIQYTTPRPVVHKIFSYGTLNLHDVQRYLWGEAKNGVVRALHDFELDSYDNNIFFIKKKFGESVAGKVYDLNEEQLARTDTYEGSAYTREKVTIDGELVNVYVQVKE